METQAIDKENLLQRIVLLLAAIGVIAALVLALGLYQSRQVDPYVRQVLSLTGNSVQGSAIFQMNCAGCHGAFADGRVGPSLLNVSARKSKVNLIYQVISGQTPPMPQFQPSPQAMADLLSYLEKL